jgi:hypothetical protein
MGGSRPPFPLGSCMGGSRPPFPLGSCMGGSRPPFPLALARRPALAGIRRGGLPRAGIARARGELSGSRHPSLSLTWASWACGLPGTRAPGVTAVRSLACLPVLSCCGTGGLPRAGVAEPGAVLPLSRRPALARGRPCRLPRSCGVDARSGLSLAASPALSRRGLPGAGIPRILAVLSMAGPALSRSGPCGLPGARAPDARAEPPRRLLARPVLTWPVLTWPVLTLSELALAVLPRIRRRSVWAGHGLAGRTVPGWPERVWASARVSRSVPRLARPGLLRTVLARLRLSGPEVTGSAVLVTAGWHRSCRPGRTRRVGGRPPLRGPRVAGSLPARPFAHWPRARRTLARPSRRRPPVVPRLPRRLLRLRLPRVAVRPITRPVRASRLARPPRLPLASAVGLRPALRLVVIRTVAAGTLGAWAAWGSRGPVGGSPVPVRHHGLLHCRADAAGRLRPGALIGRAPAVCLAPPGPWPWAATGRARRRFVWPRPRAVRRAHGRVARCRPRRPRRLICLAPPRPQRRAALLAVAQRAGRHVSRPWPVAGMAAVTGIDRVGARVQGGAEQLSVLWVAVAVGGFGGPATRATARPAALTIHPVPPDQSVFAACSDKLAAPG